MIAGMMNRSSLDHRRCLEVPRINRAKLFQASVFVITIAIDTCLWLTGITNSSFIVEIEVSATPSIDIVTQSHSIMELTELFGSENVFVSNRHAHENAFQRPLHPHLRPWELSRSSIIARFCLSMQRYASLLAM